MINFFTSIAPFQIEKQVRAIESWIDLGISVHSINSQNEIDCLYQEFPKINFHPVMSNGHNLYGKPYVFLNDVFQVALNVLRSKDVFVLCNSDIFIDNTFYEPSQFVVNPNEMVLATRFNVSDRHLPIGLDYDCGIDIFCANMTALNSFGMDEFCLGVPFWDFWLPIKAIHNGLSVKKLNYPLAIHVNHPENYSHGNLQKAALLYIKKLMGCQPEFLLIYQRLLRSIYGQEYEGVLMNQVIYPTLAIFHRNFIEVNWMQDIPANSFGSISHAMFTTLKHSSAFAIALRLYIKLFDYIHDFEGTSLLNIAEHLADEVSGFDEYPLYSAFYIRSHNGFCALSKKQKSKQFMQDIMPVLDAVSIFSKLEGA
jgi:hypothetical protein